MHIDYYVLMKQDINNLQIAAWNDQRPHRRSKILTQKKLELPPRFEMVKKYSNRISVNASLEFTMDASLWVRSLLLLDN